jgi:hypothetical protein
LIWNNRQIHPAQTPTGTNLDVLPKNRVLYARFDEDLIFIVLKLPNRLYLQIGLGLLVVKSAPILAYNYNVPNNFNLPNKYTLDPRP